MSFVHNQVGHGLDQFVGLLLARACRNRVHPMVDGVGT